MAWYILFILVLLPLFELFLLIEAGQSLGALNTIALCLLTAFIGLSLVRAQGLKVFQDFQKQHAAHETDTHAPTHMSDLLIHGVFLAVAGLLLMFPGFATDFLGALLLIPQVRLLLGRTGAVYFVSRTAGNRRHTHSRTAYRGTRGNAQTQKETHTRSYFIVEGEIVENTPQTPKTSEPDTQQDKNRGKDRDTDK